MGFRVLDGLWAVLEPLLPAHANTHRFGGGRPRRPDRACADAIFDVLRTGCQWQALDQTELVAHSTTHDRFQAWAKAEVFLAFWQTGVGRFDEHRGIDWAWRSLAGAMTKAPLGGEKNRPQSDGSRQGRSQAQLADRGARRAGWLGGGRRQPA